MGLWMKTVERVVHDKVYVCTDGREFSSEWEARDHEFGLALTRLFPGREDAVRAATKKLYSKFVNSQSFILNLDAELNPNGIQETGG